MEEENLARRMRARVTGGETGQSNDTSTKVEFGVFNAIECPVREGVKNYLSITQSKVPLARMILMDWGDVSQIAKH